MNGVTIPVFLDKSNDYSTEVLEPVIERMCELLELPSKVEGKKVLLKPNLLTAKPPAYSCTDPRFILCVARWFVEHGAEVYLGDSPAFGTTTGVLKSLGLIGELEKLDIKVADFSSIRKVEMENGGKLLIAKEALECDLLINLPKVKAHSQMYTTLAVKNLFGTVKGFHKAMLHVSHGDSYAQFSEMLLFLSNCFKDCITIVDGIEVIHKAGPIDGESLMAGIVAGGWNTMAIDVGLTTLLGLDQSQNPLIIEGQKKMIPGAFSHNIHYPLLSPEDFKISFCAPVSRKPISFHPLKLTLSMFKRLWRKISAS